MNIPNGVVGLNDLTHRGTIEFNTIISSNIFSINDANSSLLTNFSFESTGNKRVISDVYSPTELECSISNKKTCTQIYTSCKTIVSDQNTSDFFNVTSTTTNEQNVLKNSYINDNTQNSPHFTKTPVDFQSIDNGDFSPKINFNEEECCVTNVETNSGYQKFKIDFDSNINNLKNINIDQELAKSIQRFDPIRCYRYCLFYDLNSYIKNHSDYCIPFNQDLLKSTILYLNQIMENIHHATNEFNTKAFKFIIKAMFYLVYPLYKIIHFKQCNKSVEKLYFDFSKLCEILTLTRKTFVSVNKKRLIRPEMDLMFEYEIQKAKFLKLNIGNAEIENLESALKQIAGTGQRTT